MKCKFCGEYISPNHNRCPGCGRSAGVLRGDHTARFNEEDIEKNRVVSVLSYLSFLVLIPMLFTRRSRYARFHANQGLILFIVSPAYTLATRIFVKMLDLLFGGVYAAIPSTLATIFAFGSLFFIILALLGMANAAAGKAKELPLIGKARFLV